MRTWIAFPHAGEYRFDAASATALWPRLHAGDAEPLPADPDVLRAWVLLHNGEFERAAEAGLQTGGAGITAANKATCIYANYLEKTEKVRLDLFMEVAQRAERQIAEDGRNPSSWYWHAFALGRYSQGISVSRALAQGLGGKIKESLEQAIRLQPRHADAHIALAVFHAEVIDKVGSLIGGMTYGAKKDIGLQLFQEALKINPASPIAMTEYATGLMMLEGETSAPEATRLYERAASCDAVDAIERLQIELARTELVE